ncbi:MAG TPA: hypothetical protein VGG20_09700 [Thermoanaerobaculia bacterium]
MKRPALVSCLFLLLAAGSWGIALQKDGGNSASRHLAGEWHLHAELSQRLTGQRTGAPDLVSITADPSVLESLPPQIDALRRSSPVYLAGTLTFGKTRFTFLLTDQEGSQRLILFPPGSSGSGAFSILFDVIPAQEPLNDILFLGSETDGQPIFAYERVALPKTSQLSEQTRALLLDALTNNYSPALKSLPERPDWQAVIDLLVEEMRNDPSGLHNYRSIVLHSLISRHLAEARLNVKPLLAVVASQSWTNQQKTSIVLADAVRRPDLFKGEEKETIRAMIPLTASQRGPVVEPALQVLHALTGEKDLQRDPLAWARWFEAHYGDKIDLRGSVYELVDVIAIETSSNGALSFRADGKHVQDKEKLRAQIQGFISRARAVGLRPRLVALVPTPITSIETGNQASREARPVQEILGSLGIEEYTVTPDDTVFYPPFEPGFPPKPGKP